MKLRTVFVAFVAFVLTSSIEALPSRANPDFDLGPAVNAKAPDIGSPSDQTGRRRTLASLMGENGLVLFFFRSADWCPYCQA